MAARRGGVHVGGGTVFELGQACGQGIDAGFQRGHLIGGRHVQSLEYALHLVIEGLVDLVPGSGCLLAGFVQRVLDVVAPARFLLAAAFTAAGLPGFAFLHRAIEETASLCLRAPEGAQTSQPDLLCRIAQLARKALCLVAEAGIVVAAIVILVTVHCIPRGSWAYPRE